MLSLILIGILVCFLGFALVWAFCLRCGNYSFLDVAFSYGLAVLVPLYAWKGDGDFLRKLCFSVLGVIWSLRLGTYILIRVLRHHPSEDQRYQALRERWPGPWMFLLFFELQAFLVVVFSSPFLIASFNAEPALTALEFAGLSTALAGIVGETIADRQMAQFKKASPSSGAVCQAGLWRYSRHPNYFFESLVWCGFSIAALSSPWGWVCLACPLLMLYFLLRVTGIPLTEAYAVNSKGDAYREYQKTTSMFVPWFRKNLSASKFNSDQS